MFRLQYTPTAVADLRLFSKADQRRIIETADRRLAVQPTTESRHVKRLRPNRLAEWELRVGDFRVFYDVVEVEVRVNIVAVGVKRGSALYVHGQEYDL